jgi:hypothetical protein
MAGQINSSISYAMTKAQPLLSSSPRLPWSLEDSLKRVGVLLMIGKKMRKPSYFQWTENRFTGSLMLRKLSGVLPIGAQVLEDTH